MVVSQASQYRRSKIIIINPFEINIHKGNNEIFKQILKQYNL